jgi:hypothetical protein
MQELTPQDPNLPALPPQTPFEGVQLSPEMLEVANCYLQVQDVREVANQLDIEPGRVSMYLARPEVKRYIDQVFLDVGFNNRQTLRRAMDAIIKRKFQEMEESDQGSQKDILDILTLSHKMTMDHINAQIKLEQIRQARQVVQKPERQVNVQINNTPDTPQSNYDRLLERLMGGTGA